MNSGLPSNSPTIVSAFQSLLKQQFLVVLVFLALFAICWNLLLAVRRRDAAFGRTIVEPHVAEPAARKLLRIAFGLIWIFDGILQAQSAMPLGMTPQVIEPTAASSPSWVQHIVNFGGTIWSNHPITAPASAVWIQVGIGLWLLVAPHGWWSRVGGLVSVGWGLIVWVLGEAFGGVFAPGLTWAFGAPGAVLFYCAAGALIALPARAWTTPHLGRWILRVMGAFFIGMAVLQAWPGRGFWQGHIGRAGTPGTLASMVQSMSSTPQPHLLSSWVASFGTFDVAHGWAVNLFLVVALAVIGVCFATAQPRIVAPAVVVAVVLCLADWVLIEDWGFLGGLGTDPNSMIPMSVVFIAGYLALTRPAVDAPAVVPITEAGAASDSWWAHLTRRPTYVLRCAAALGAIGVVVLGAAPMAAASLNPTADPIISEAVNGPPITLNQPAPPFTLVDQSGHSVTLASLRGKVVVLAFLDPVCVSDCPLIGHELKAADEMLGASARRVEFVAVNLNPLYRTTAYLQAYDAQEGLTTVSNWLYVTGSLAQLEQTWAHYHAAVSYATGGTMILHNDIAYVIDASGHLRDKLYTDPGPGTQATQSSTSVLVTNTVTAVLGS